MTTTTGVEMYREHILEHYRSPRNFGTLDPADITHREDNPLCGDDIGIDVRLAGERIVEIRFHGQGCAISQASASLLTEDVKGKSLGEVRRLDKSRVLELLAIPISPVRTKCALLALDVLQGGIKARDAGPKRA